MLPINATREPARGAFARFQRSVCVGFFLEQWAAIRRIISGAVVAFNRILMTDTPTEPIPAFTDVHYDFESSNGGTQNETTDDGRRRPIRRVVRRCRRPALDFHPAVTPPPPPSADGRLADDVVFMGDKTITDGVACLCSLVPEGDPAMDKASVYVRRYREVSARLNGRTDLPCGFLIQSSIGHGWTPGMATPWQKIVRSDGTSSYRFCPLGEKFRAYVTLTGVRAVPWAGKKISFEDFGDRRLSGATGTGPADLRDRAPGVAEVSRLFNRVSALASEETYLAPGSVRFENGRGGRVLALAATVPAEPLHHRDYGYCNETRKTWLVGELARLAGTFPGGVYYSGDESLLCLSGRTSRGERVVLLDSLDLDPVERPRLFFADAPRSVERLSDDGTWAALPFTRAEDGLLVFETVLRPHRPLVLRCLP